MGPPMSSAYLWLGLSCVVMRSPLGVPFLWGKPCGNAYRTSPYPGMSSVDLYLLTCGVKSVFPIMRANASSLPAHIMCWSVSHMSPSE